MTDERMDRYARGELMPAEARELAQASLDNPELFDELTSTALAKAAVNAPSARQHMKQARRAPLYWVLAAAAAAVVLGVYLSRPKPAPIEPLTPTLAISNVQPVLLASGLVPETRESTPVFRGPEGDSRAPRQTGTILSIDDGEASFDLGSLDGVVKGAGLQIIRNGENAGLLTVTTVFRERARGRIPSTGAVAGSYVRVPDSGFMAALIEQIDAQLARGDLQRARGIAGQAAERTSADVNPEQKRAALQKLAALEYQAGSPDAAEKHYEAAKGLLEGAPASEQSQVLNNLAVLHMLRGDPAGAEAPLAQARAIGKNDLPYARTMNNLGVLAELRGDHTKALSLYADALAALAAIADAPASDRQAVEANLTRVRNSR